MDITERGDREVKGEGTGVKERVTLRITLLSGSVNCYGRDPLPELTSRYLENSSDSLFSFRKKYF